MSYTNFSPLRLPSFFLTLILAVGGMVLCAAASVLAAPDADSPVAPVAARISPSGGLLEVEQQAPVIRDRNGSHVRIILPAGAEDFEVVVPGHTVVRWSTLPQILEQGSVLARLRGEKQRNLMTLSGQLDAVKSRIGLWSAEIPNSMFQDMVQREKRVDEAMPVLSYEKAELERQIGVLRQELELLPATPELGQAVLVTLQKSIASSTLPVRYRYTLRNCGWRPVYIFDARPGKGKDDATGVRFMADVWQFSGLDWSSTRLTLVSGGEGPREPAPLPRWIVDSQAPPQAQALTRGAPRMTAASAETTIPEVTPPARVVAESGGVYASWTLTEQGLPEGHARLLVAEDVWKAPFAWLARPSDGESRVWIMAHYTLPPGKAWPEGSAEFHVDGQSLGAGQFRPRGSDVTLYFGADPRVQVRVAEGTRRHGEKGLIAKSRTWSWAWTYTLSNTRDRTVSVRLERPMPMLADQNVTVTYSDSPQAQQDAQEHTLFWNVETPAGGKAEVRHALTIVSPVEMQLNPDAP